MVMVFYLPFENTGNLVKGVNKMEENYEIVKFVDDELELQVRADKINETVWLTQKEMSLLFGVSTDNIGLHIRNILKDGELDFSVTEESSVVQMEGNRSVTRKVKLHNLDMIISVGYRVKSKRGITFRKWANRVLKEYLIQGYSVNQKRLEALNKTIEIQNRMLSYSLNIEQEALVNVVSAYTNALNLLDNYDHQCLEKPKGRNAIYVLKYDECRKIIDGMRFGNSSDIFGVEKTQGKLNGILLQIYQNVFGTELYPSLEEKAAHLLYFLVKDHPFVDGCKRIAATLFLEFLNKNHALVKNGRLVIANDTLVAITVLAAESKPEEMNIIINLIMNFLVNR